RRRVVVDGELHGTPDIMSMVLIRSCCAGGNDMLQGHCVRSIGLAGWKLSDFSDDPACPDPPRCTAVRITRRSAYGQNRPLASGQSASAQVPSLITCQRRPIS